VSYRRGGFLRKSQIMGDKTASARKTRNECGGAGGRQRVVVGLLWLRTIQESEASISTCRYSIDHDATGRRKSKMTLSQAKSDHEARVGSLLTFVPQPTGQS
jgi:hypothetical protein